MIPIVPNAKTIAYVVAAILIVAIIYVYGGGIFDKGDRINHIRTELSDAQRENSEAGKHIDTITSGVREGAAEAGRISDGVGKVSVGLGETSNTLSGVRDRIDSSKGEFGSIKQILNEDEGIYREIRARGPIKN